MLSYLRKRWNYLLAKLNLRHEETADPKVQLEQAISEAKDQHRRLREQAANVVANQKQTEMRINDALEKLDGVLRSIEAVLFLILDQPLIGLTGLIKGIPHDLGMFISGPKIIFTMHDKQRQI